MFQSIFDSIVLFQDKTLTGSWDPIVLFIIVFLTALILLNLKKKEKDKSIDNEIILKNSFKAALFAILLNYITGNLFKSRQKLYRTKKGFSKQRAKAQAYADSRMGHIISGMSIA